MDNKLIFLIVFQILLILVQLLLKYEKIWCYLFDYEQKNISAIAYLNSEIKGSIYFIENQEKNIVTVKLNLSGLLPNKELGFHIHAAGDLSDGFIFTFLTVLENKLSALKS